MSDTIAVVLGARNEPRLARLEQALIANGVPHVAIREPDAPWLGQLMAIGLVPMGEDGRGNARAILKDFQTLRALDA